MICFHSMKRKARRLAGRKNGARSRRRDQCEWRFPTSTSTDWAAGPEHMIVQPRRSRTSSAGIHIGQTLVRRFCDFLAHEIRPAFSEPVYVNGSFVTDKEAPEDVDGRFSTCDRRPRPGSCQESSSWQEKESDSIRNTALISGSTFPGPTTSPTSFGILARRPPGTKDWTPGIGREF